MVGKTSQQLGKVAVQAVLNFYGVLTNDHWLVGGLE